jgi:hypothetical protein
MRYLILLPFVFTVLLRVQLLDSPEIEIEKITITYTFGEIITFESDIRSDQPIEEVLLFLQPENQTTRLGSAFLNDAGKYIYLFDTRQDPMEPFVEIQYWYRITCQNGDEYESEKFTFEYTDNRFDWQKLEDGHFKIHWYDSDTDFGQDILNVSNLALESVQALLPAEFDSLISIYVYASSNDLQSALQFSQRSWIAGHSNPKERLILISISPSPSQKLELERQIPHELMHLAEYQLAGASYSKLPVWLVEGIASMAELYPNPDYQRVLDVAIEQRSLIPMDTLCASFPRDASSAFMAYAQSESFTRYILENFGSSGLLDLIDKYSDGLGCEEGLQATYGISLRQMELRWQQQTLGVDSGVFIIQNLTPYIFLLGVILLVPTFSIISGVFKHK